MQVILLDKVINLGALGKQVNVKSGYARNFLIPQGKAIPASKKNIAYFQSRRIELEAQLNKALVTANNRAETIKLLGIIVIKARAGEEGKLFGSIGAKDIAHAITTAGIEVSKREIRLPNGILRMIGKHEVGIQLHSDVFIQITVDIVAR